MPALEEPKESQYYMPSPNMYDMFTVYKYSGIPVDRLINMDAYEYRILLVNAFCLEALKTEEGRKLLSTYKRIHNMSTEMDVESLQCSS